MPCTSPPPVVVVSGLVVGAVLRRDGSYGLEVSAGAEGVDVEGDLAGHASRARVGLAAVERVVVGPCGGHPSAVVGPDEGLGGACACEVESGVVTAHVSGSLGGVDVGVGDVDAVGAELIGYLVDVGVVHGFPCGWVVWWPGASRRPGGRSGGVVFV